MLQRRCYFVLLILFLATSTVLQAQSYNRLPSTSIPSESTVSRPVGYTSFLIARVELFLTKHISTSGEIWSAMESTSGSGDLVRSNFFTAGFDYHFFPNGTLDPYVGIVPSAAINATSYRNDGSFEGRGFNVLPVVGLTVGCNWNVSQSLGIFVKFHLFNKNISSGMIDHRSPDALNFTGGIGINLRTMKVKK